MNRVNLTNVVILVLVGAVAQGSSTVSEPRWVAMHGDHLHSATTFDALALACAEDFPKSTLNTDQVAGSVTDACVNFRYEVSITYGPNPEPVERWTRVAQEGGIVTPPAERKYRYGCDDADTTISPGCPAGDRWSASRNFSTTFTCNNSTFGGDPIYGVRKTCQVSSFSPGMVPEPANGTAKLAWVAPTKNTDETPLTNLAGFRIVYGENPQQMVQSIQLPDRYATTYTVGSLAKGTWYFTVRAYNSDGSESANANIVSKVIP